MDLAPTLLYGLGFPVARDLDGQVLTAAFDKGFLARHPLTFFPSYEGLAKTEHALDCPQAFRPSTFGATSLGPAAAEALAASRVMEQRPSKMAPSSMTSDGVSISAKTLPLGAI